MGVFKNFVFRTALAVLMLTAVPQSIASGAQPAGETVRIGVIDHNPPYILENPSSGIHVDSIRAAFANTGKSVEFVHAPLIRLGVLMKLGRIDAMTAYRNRPGLCELSDTFGYWHDGVIVRTALGKDVKTMADLADLRVGMFPAAKDVFAETINPHVAKFGSEIVIFSTSSVLRMLQYGRIDAYIGDSWWLDYLFDGQDNGQTVPPYRVAIQFEPTAQKLCFDNQGLRTIFNTGLDKAKANGDLKKIEQKYRARSGR